MYIKNTDKMLILPGVDKMLTKMKLVTIRYGDTVNLFAFFVVTKS